MKLNIAFPSTGRQKIIELEDEKKIRLFQDRRLAEEIDGTLLGEEYKGYIFKITGGSDKEGFPMKQGVLTSDRVRLFLAEGTSCYNRYRGQKRVGTRKRKSVRGAVISNEIVVVNLVILKKGEQEITDLTEVEKAIPNRLGPKRASKIRKLFSLTKKDNVKEYVIRREIPLKEGSKRKKPRSKAPKIQRLITARKLQHKRERKAEKLRGRERAKKEVEAYNQLIKKRRNEEIQKRRQLSSRRKSKLSKKEEGTTSTTTKKTEPKTETTKTEKTTTKRTQPTKNTKTEPSTKKVKTTTTTTKQPTKTVPTKTVPTKDTPTKETPTKTVPTKTTKPTKTVPTKTTKPTKTVPTKDTPTTQPTKTTAPTKETTSTKPTKTTKTVTKNAPTQPTKKTNPTKKTVPNKKPATKKN